MAVAGHRRLFRHLKAWGCSPFNRSRRVLPNAQARKLEQRKLEDEATSMFELAAPVDGRYVPLAHGLGAELPVGQKWPGVHGAKQVGSVKLGALPK